MGLCRSTILTTNTSSTSNTELITQGNASHAPQAPAALLVAHDSASSFRDKYMEFANKQHMAEVYECIIAIGIYKKIPSGGGHQERAFREIYECYNEEVNISSELRECLRNVYERGPYHEKSLDTLLWELKSLVKQNFISSTTNRSVYKN